MRVAIYLRVSTNEQSTENQLPVLEQLCQHRGWTVAEVYQEHGSAWHSGHQPELAGLIKEARLGKFDILLCWALDRLSREGALAILRLVDKLKHYGVRVVSYQEGWTEAPGELAEVFYSLTGWVARMESQRQSDRVKAGLERARRDGQGKRGPDRARRKRRWWKAPK